jgi:hypothetical protein
MRYHNDATKLFIAGLLLTLLLPACSMFNRLAGSSDADGTHELKVTIKDAYEGVKDGNAESVPLLDDNIYVTVVICIENLLSTERSVDQQDVFMVTRDNNRIFPTALGYDQAEAFSWLLPIAEPLGAKRIENKFYFFLIQNNELLKIPAYQSQGCNTSFQFKSLALLFLVRKEVADQSYVLHFLDEDTRFTVRRFSFWNYVKCGIYLGFFFILILTVVIVVIRSRSKARASSLQVESYDDPNDLNRDTKNT